MGSEEQSLQREIVRQLETRGWVVLETFKGSSRGGSVWMTKGMPDLIIVKNGVVAFIEVKTPIGRLSNAQKTLHEKLKNNGASVYVVRSVEQCCSVVQGLDKQKEYSTISLGEGGSPKEGGDEMKLKAQNRVEQIVPGTYRAKLEEVQIGMMSSRYHEGGVPTLRFVFELTKGAAAGTRLSLLAGLPLGSGETLRYSERSKFWKILGALTGEGLSFNLAQWIELEIPEISDLESLPSLIDSPAQVVIKFRNKSIVGAEAILVVAVERRDGKEVVLIKDVLPSIPV